MAKQIGVLLVEPDAELAHWLSRLIQRTDGFVLLGCCAKPGDLEAMAARHLPGLIILDSHAAAKLDPGELARLRGRIPGLVVALAGLENGAKYEGFARGLGADGFFCKTRLPQFLAELAEGRG